MTIPYRPAASLCALVVSVTGYDVATADPITASVDAGEPGSCRAPAIFERPSTHGYSLTSPDKIDEALSIVVIFVAYGPPG
eukprot:CAMPEP_0194070486 /NCGR_PEP_ID=MMETSP0009_2-20130614/88212_1 /TAXON_ID=210454 /ORGANISM="Grammatophora oceanica, Strain CCMP 410" /LENGTH=80 /DNA_ID=CAMNT_0038723765 /DNA_START=943 /DNA_END=1185 /DNA_ORIENTATION=-